jgi:hypothetical protein
MQRLFSFIKIVAGVFSSLGKFMNNINNVIDTTNNSQTNNPNRADISVFENLQRETNNTMGYSSQSVFNDAQTVCNSRWTQHIVRETKNIDKLYQNYAKVGITVEEIAADY